MPTKPIRPVAIGSPSHEVRIIGGQWKRSKIKVIDRPGLRPTPDRVRETLFNWLGQDLTDWRCVDAFAGTGALGFEAASRGAQSVLMLEQDAQLVMLLSQTRERLKAHTVQVQKGDAMMALQRLAPSSLDVVFFMPTCCNDQSRDNPSKPSGAPHESHSDRCLFWNF
ncbi:MAG: RsmD family RNA methyltransferase [Comamonadaceae bacterium]|nr:RsmD family RNA methyltransferase [Comamonadaceae bacterium]